MRECTDTTVGALLHAYELGLLDDSGRQNFELHLMDCESCLDKVKQLAQTASLIRFDPQVRSIVAEIVVGEESAKVEVSRLGFMGRLIALPMWVRYATAAVITIVLGLSAYRLIDLQPPTASINQTLTFNTVRSVAVNAVDRSRGGDVLLRFFVETEKILPEYEICVLDPTGALASRTPHYSSLDSAGFGQITLSTTQLLPGVYRLQVLTASDSLSRVLREYVFSVR